MACKFACLLSYSESFRENEVCLFKSESVDNYLVKYRSNVRRDLLLTLEWDVPKYVVVTVKLFNKTFKRLFSTKGTTTNGKKAFIKIRGAFNVCKSPNYKILCVISIFPYVKFEKMKNVSVAPDLPLEMECQQFPVDKTMNHCKEVLTMKDYNSDKTETLNKINANEVLNYCDFTQDCTVASQNNDAKDCKLIDLNNHSTEEGSLIGESQKVLMNNCSSESSLMDTIIVESDCDTFKTSTVTKTGLLIEVEKQEISVDNDITPEIETSMSPNKYANRCTLDDFSTVNKSQQLLKNRKNVQFDDLSEITTDGDSGFSSSHNSRNNLVMEMDFLEWPNSKLKTLKSAGMENFSFNNIEGLNIQKISLLKDIAEKFNKIMQMEFQNLPTDNQKELISGDGHTSVIGNSALEENEMLALNRISTENNTISEVNLQDSLVDNFFPISDDMNDSEIKDLPVIYDQSARLKAQEKFQNVKDMLKDLDRHNQLTSGITHDNLRKNEVMNCQGKLPSSDIDEMSQILTEKLSGKDNVFTPFDIGHEPVIGRKTTTEAEKPPDIKEKISKKFPAMESQLRGLSFDMLDLLMSGTMADAVLSNGVKTMKVHKAILCARSPILNEIFNHNTAENKENGAFVDVPSYLMEDFVVFLYVGLVNIQNVKMARDLFRVGVKYCIEDLVDLCSKYVSK